MRKIIVFIFLAFILKTSNAQIGTGVIVYTDFYNRYFHPTDNIADRSAGSTLLNLGIGPKIWFGSKDISLSVEAVANLSLFGLSIDDYKGLGMVSFPFLAKLNFKGASSFSTKGNLGFYFGGGIQYNKTELYYLKTSFHDAGVNRDIFKTYVGELGVGFGINGVVLNGFFRYGYHPDNDAKTYNFGIAWDFNFQSLKKIDRPESKLF